MTRHVAIVEERGDGWVASVPDGEQILVHDPRSITREVREQLAARPGAGDRIEVRLADPAGTPVHGFVLLFVRPEDRARVADALRNLITVPFKFDMSGCRIALYQPDGL